jgi:hypothetical protein
MTAEFPDMSLVELAERRALAEEEAKEIAALSLADLNTEITRRETALDELRTQYREVEIRIVERRLHWLREDLARRVRVNDGAT